VGKKRANEIGCFGELVSSAEPGSGLPSFFSSVSSLSLDDSPVFFAYFMNSTMATASLP